MKYKLTCTSWNTAHVKFNLFDPTGANCGQICIHALDLINFLQNSWKGEIFWNGNMPEWLWDPAKYPAHSRHLTEPMQYDPITKIESIEGIQKTALEELKDVQPIPFCELDEPPMDEGPGGLTPIPYFRWNDKTKTYEPRES
jgi:hypothetical protein